MHGVPHGVSLPLVDGTQGEIGDGPRRIDGGLVSAPMERTQSIAEDFMGLWEAENPNDAASWIEPGRARASFRASFGGESREASVVDLQRKESERNMKI